MKKLILTLFGITVIFIACKNNNEQETDDKSKPEEIVATFDSTDLVTTEVAEDENAPQTIHYNFNQGDSYNYRMTIISENDQTIQTDTTTNNSLRQTLTYLINLKTVATEGDSISELECTFKSVNLKANANGQEVTYTSGSLTDSAEVAKFAEYEAFIDNPFRIRVTKLGAILDIFRADKISNKFLTLRGLLDSVTTEQKLGIRDDLVNNLIRPMIAQIIREVPDKKIAPDSSWSYQKASIPVMVFQINYTNKYVLEKFEKLNDDLIAVIDAIVDAKIDGEPTYTNQGINYEFEIPISSASGKIYFNLDKGLVQKSKTQTRLETAYKMTMPTPQGTQSGNTREVIFNTNILELL